MDSQIRAAIQYESRFPSRDRPPDVVTPALYVAAERKVQRTWEAARLNGFVPDPVAFALIDALLRRGINAPYDLCSGSYKHRLPGEWRCPDCGKRTVAEHRQDAHMGHGMIHHPHNAEKA